MKNIVVIMGGTSNEREVSIQSGSNIAKALQETGRYHVEAMRLDTNSLPPLPPNCEAVYIALHGGWGENGGVQKELNARKMPYTGPGAEASKLAMDKIATKRILDQAGFPTAPWYTLTPCDVIPPCRFEFPVVVKAPRDGSSFSVAKCANAAEFEAACRDAWKTDEKNDLGTQVPEALIEAYIPGREATVGLIDGEPLPVIEIVTPNEWYGFADKYTSDVTRYPFLEEQPLAKKLQEIAQAAYQAIGCRGVTRVDFRIRADGSIYVLELNTSPGFTSHSLVPKAGMKTGLTFAEVCEKILASADYDR